MLRTLRQSTRTFPMHSACKFATQTHAHLQVAAAAGGGSSSRPVIYITLRVLAPARELKHILLLPLLLGTDVMVFALTALLDAL